jgi:hypothetical protein
VLYQDAMLIVSGAAIMEDYASIGGLVSLLISYYFSLEHVMRAHLLTWPTDNNQSVVTYRLHQSSELHTLHLMIQSDNQLVCTLQRLISDRTAQTINKLLSLNNLCA